MKSGRWSRRIAPGQAVVVVQGRQNGQGLAKAPPSSDIDPRKPVRVCPLVNVNPPKIAFVPR